MIAWVIVITDTHITSGSGLWLWLSRHSIFHSVQLYNHELAAKCFGSSPSPRRLVLANVQPQRVDKIALATLAPDQLRPSCTHTFRPGGSSKPFEVWDEAFMDILGAEPSLETLVEVPDYAFAWEARACQIAGKSHQLTFRNSNMDRGDR